MLSTHTRPKTAPKGVKGHLKMCSGPHKCALSQRTCFFFFGIRGQCCCYLPTFANVGLRRNIGVYKANAKCWFNKCRFDNSPASKSRQITVIHECTPNLAYIWPKCMPRIAYIQSDNHAKSRQVTLPKYAYIPNVALRGLHSNDSKYDQHGVCGVHRHYTYLDSTVVKAE